MADYTFDVIQVEAPELQFKVEEAPAAQAAVAVAEAAPAAQAASSAAKVGAELADSLTEREIAQAEAFVNQIDINDSAAVMSYGASTQKKMADFSEKALDNVRTKDMGEVGKMVADLVTELKNFEIDEDDGKILGFFKKKKNNLDSMKAKYSKVETNVETIQNKLEEHQVQLLKDSAMLDRMYDANLSYFKELTMYILAGRQKLEQVRSVDLVELEKKAEASGSQMDAQAAKDLAAACDRFEKKLYDLELTRTISMQTAPQIRMVQASDNEMAEKIQSTIVNTIPLWKNQMIIALGVEHSMEAAKAQHMVSEMTNDLLKKNADALKVATIETAKEAERGIVDIETLKHTNETLISTLDEIMVIQKDGKQKRAEAQAELSAIESQLKDKLLEAAKMQN